MVSPPRRGGRKVAPINGDQAVHRRRNAVAHVFDAGGELRAHALVAEVLKQGRGVDEIGHREALSESTVHRAERPEGFFAAALLLPKSREARRGAQFPRFALLALGRLDGATKAFLGSGLIA